MNTIENNKLIAEFMGIDFNVNEFQMDSQSPLYPYLLTANMRYWDERDGDFDLNPYSFLIFHEDWNWLMPVVEKIEILGFGTSIAGGSKGFACVITNGIENSFLGNNKTDETKREAMFIAVIEFIKWYNFNK